MKLTKKQVFVLNELSGYDEGELVPSKELKAHGVTLNSLKDKGLIEWGTPEGLTYPITDSYYRLTGKGYDVLAEHI